MTPAALQQTATTGPTLTVDVTAVTANVRAIRRLTAGEVMAVVKSDGFGHGLADVARAALAGGATRFGVTSLEEAYALRDAGFTQPVLSWLNPVDSDFGGAARAGVEIAVPGDAHLRAVARQAPGARVHLQLDTGMARDGAPPEQWESLCHTARRAERAGFVRVVGVMGHLACAAEPGHPANGRGRELFDWGVRVALGAGLPAAGITALALAGLAVPLPTDAQEGSLRVAAIQGNVPEPGGYDALGEKFQVTRNHVDQTLKLAADVAAGRVPAPDLVVWPENSSDVDPLRDPRAAALLDEAAAAVGVPILVGAVLDGPGEGHVSNAGLIWTTDGFTGDMYVKHRPVPFAEYLPGRDVLEKIITRFATEMPNDFVHGTGPAALPAAGTMIGDVICFEVAYDGNVRASVDDGARLLVVQTNNASFGRNGESQQQLAMTRIRAVEHGRATIQVSTSGQSAIITPDGTVLAQTGLYEPGILSADLPLRTARTLADRVGVIPEAVAVALGLAAMMGGTILGRRRRAGAETTETGATGPGPDHHGRWERTPPTSPRPDGRRSERNGVDHRVVVCVPTYNERENLTRTAHRLREANPTVDLLVIDDNSPDGTGEIADELAREDPRIHVLHRAGKSGLGSAYIAGFSWALRHGYDVIVEMDADGSHQPEQLPRLLTRLDAGADLVIGSRWVPGGQVHNWPRRRLVLSRGANAYVRAALRIPLRDATAGYRAYRAEVLRARDLDKIQSQGYCFQVDLAWTAWRHGFSVAEVPITFVERERGSSKMSRSIIIEAFWRTALWALTSGRSGPAPRPAATPITVPAPAPEPALVAATGPATPQAQPTTSSPSVASTAPGSTATLDTPIQQQRATGDS
ncbi:apolipoprotein N-acyltransferase [Frankia nepalensis]|uniref:apolipoprotein N-acyltransferase n=1 Tax=Frankia nepalensis TaxID=1836974 RepID=UPI00288BC54C|nr:apolipoprotein N-acyltransferase [Frankia nepalensis]